MKALKIIFIYLLAYLITGMSVYSQDLPKSETRLEIQMSYSDANSFSLALQRTHGIFASKKVRLGYGLRFSSFSSNNASFFPAPLKLASNKDLYDTLVVSSASISSLNTSIFIGYSFSKKWNLSFSIDALGIGFGKKKEAVYYPNNLASTTYPAIIEISPTSTNVLLVGDNDIGQLKSVFQLGYTPKEKFRIQAGIDYTFTEYRTAIKVQNENDRFRKKTLMASIGVSILLK